mmetsp:Transcript_54873/g.123847  ORF Transcript_54873/g.123847 Transcript_54873/m.123847 type:complete len:279 (-) Transcript_54873:90-926(-)
MFLLLRMPDGPRRKLGGGTGLRSFGSMGGCGMGPKPGPRSGAQSALPSFSKTKPRSCDWPCPSPAAMAARTAAGPPFGPPPDSKPKAGTGPATPCAWYTGSEKPLACWPTMAAWTSCRTATFGGPGSCAWMRNCRVSKACSMAPECCSAASRRCVSTDSWLCNNWMARCCDSSACATATTGDAVEMSPRPLPSRLTKCWPYASESLSRMATFSSWLLIMLILWMISGVSLISKTLPPASPFSQSVGNFASNGLLKRSTYSSEPILLTMRQFDAMSASA